VRARERGNVDEVDDRDVGPGARVVRASTMVVSTARAAAESSKITGSFMGARGLVRTKLRRSRASSVSDQKAMPATP
jgi:hypothetical protein